VTAAAAALHPSFHSVRELWSRCSGFTADVGDGILALAAARRRMQHALHTASLLRQLALVLPSLAPWQRRRLLACASAVPRSFFTTPPLEFRPPPSQVESQLAVRMRLMLPASRSGATIVCSCGFAQGARDRAAPGVGDDAARRADWHARLCRSGPASRGAHEAVAASLVGFFQDFGLQARLERGGVLVDAPRRRCDVLVVLPGSTWAIDISRVDVEWRGGTSERLSYQALLVERERAKRRSYKALAPGLTFAPLVFDEVGAIGPDSRVSLRQIAVAISEVADVPDTEVLQRMLAVIGAACVRGVQAQVAFHGAGRSPSSPPREPSALEHGVDDGWEGVFSLTRAGRGCVTAGSDTDAPSDAEPPGTQSSSSEVCDSDAADVLRWIAQARRPATRRRRQPATRVGVGRDAPAPGGPAHLGIPRTGPLRAVADVPDVSAQGVVGPARSLRPRPRTPPVFVPMPPSGDSGVEVEPARSASDPSSEESSPPSPQLTPPPRSPPPPVTYSAPSLPSLLSPHPLPHFPIPGPGAAAPTPSLVPSILRHAAAAVAELAIPRALLPAPPRPAPCMARARPPECGRPAGRSMGVLVASADTGVRGSG
jgi:hypothetical protein